MPIELRNLASGEVIEVPNDGFTIGREGGQADVKLKDKGLSNRHARIFADGMDWLVQDLGSTNGTKIAEVVVGKEAVDIRVGDVITMSDTQLEVTRIWDPTLQHTVVNMAAPVFDTKPSVQAVKRAEPENNQTLMGYDSQREAAASSSNRTMIGYGAAASPTVEQPVAAATNKTMIGYGVPAAVTVEQPAAAGEPDMTAKTLIGYSADRVAAAIAQAPVSAPPETAKTLVGFSADRVAAAMAQAPAAESNKTLIGYDAPQFAPVAAKSKPGPSTVEVAEEAEEQPQEEEVERPVVHTVRAQAVPRAKAKVGVEPESEEEEVTPPPEVEAPAEEAVSGSEQGLKYFLVAVPKAIAFYLAAVPLMIVNPKGTIRKGVEEQKHAAKGRMELIAYALPVNLFSAAVGFISTLIVQLVTGTLSIGGLLFGLLIIPAIVAVVVSVVTGFVWHPVVSWVVTKLKGESDERSRTNYFLMFMTATALVVLPNGLGILLGLVPFRLVAMVAPILSALGTVVVLFVTYSWMVKFEVVKWFRTVLLVLGGIALVVGVFGAIGRLSTPAGVGETVAGVSAGDVEAQIAAAQKQAEETTKAALAAGEDAKEQVKAAQEDVKVAVKTKDGPTAAAETSITFPVYVQMRDAVEKKIADDPGVLGNSPELQALYRDYTNTAFEIESRFKAMSEKSPADAKLNNRLRDAEVFAKTEKAIVALHAKLKPATAPAAKEEKAAPVAKEEKAKPAPVAKEEKPKPAPVAKEEKPKPAPVAKEEKPKPAPAAKEEKPKAEAKPAPAAKEEKPKAEAKPAPVAAAGKGKLAASSRPPGADIWVDGKNTGKKTPLAVSSSLELPAGKHTVIFKMGAKSSAPVEVVIEADKQLVLKGVEIP